MNVKEIQGVIALIPARSMANVVSVSNTTEKEKSFRPVILLKMLNGLTTDPSAIIIS